MTLPSPNLDDLRAQKLVDEARKKIVQYCPEWTDYNVSDPGITLIELFAWLTEKICYRLNQLPRKNYVEFLNLLDRKLKPAKSARVQLTFYLSVPFPISAGDQTETVIPSGTEVATLLTEDEPEIIFTTEKRLVIAPPKLAYIRREIDFHREYLNNSTFYVFRSEGKPQVGDTFYLGFAKVVDISGYRLRLNIGCKPQATGIDLKKPPLVWECYLNETRGWVRLQPEDDTTEGLNAERGEITFDLPLNMEVGPVNREVAYWIRCRHHPNQDQDIQPYDRSPIISRLEAYVLGATNRAQHAVTIKDEILGRSSGEPNQHFQLRHTPVLKLQPEETLIVEEEIDGEIRPVEWKRVDDFSDSKQEQRHFVIDYGTGEIRLGPGIRQADAKVKQYGRIPETDRLIRFSQYRHGGGIIGNVPAHRVEVLKSTIPYIDRVTNREPAAGGTDSETLEEAKFDALRTLRTQERLVTVADYEDFVRQRPEVLRAQCQVPGHSNRQATPGAIDIVIVPKEAEIAVKLSDLTKLKLQPEISQQIHKDLKTRSLLTTALQIRSAQYLGVKVTAKIVAQRPEQKTQLKERVLTRLRNFINPTQISDKREYLDEAMGSNWEGWPFGRNLHEAEIFSLLMRTQGVKFVPSLKLEKRQILPDGEPSPSKEQDQAKMDQNLQLVAGQLLEVRSDELLCSLNHQIEVVAEDELD